MEYRESEPYYVISVVAKILGVHAQTLRYYERVGLIVPSRSRGNRRLYSASDIERLRRIKTLIEDLGINLAGAEVIIRLGQRITELERQKDDLEKRIIELTQKCLP